MDTLSSARLSSSRPLNTASSCAIEQALSHADVFSLKRHYEQWSAHYDADVNAQAYCGPTFMIRFLQSLTPITAKGRDCRIMDACCGTGLVGEVLRQQGYGSVDGCDLSPAMVAQARATGTYRLLHGDVDLVCSLPLAFEQRYDLVLCCGAFIPGHLPPSALVGLMAMTRPGGFIVISVREAYYEAEAFQAHCHELEERHGLKLIGVHWHGPYLDGVKAHYLAFQVAAGEAWT